MASVSCRKGLCGLLLVSFELIWVYLFSYEFLQISLSVMEPYILPVPSELDAVGQAGTWNRFVGMMRYSVPKPDSKMTYAAPYHHLTPATLYRQLNWWTNATVSKEQQLVVEGVSMHVVLVHWCLFLSHATIILLFITCTTSKMCSKLCVRKKTDLELRNEQRIAQENEEREIAIQAMSKILRPSPLEPTSVEIGLAAKERGEWGSRLQKYWFRKGHLVITLAPVSKSCFYDVKFYEDDINGFLSGLGHEYLQPIKYIKYVHEDNRDQVAIAQTFWERGSLRDLIYGEATPAKDWAEKYPGAGKPLPLEKVALYASQILQAMFYLYKRQSFHAEVLLRPLGHVQTGNIYVSKEEDVCKLGGYENTLLRYKTRLHRTVDGEGLFSSIDVIMFGHVVYEMSAGRELPHLFPSEEDMLRVEPEQCKDLLDYIFVRKDDGTFHRTMKQIKANFNSFFEPKKSILEVMQFIPKVASSQVTSLYGQVSNRVKSAYGQAKDQAKNWAKRVKSGENPYDHIGPIISKPITPKDRPASSHQRSLSDPTPFTGSMPDLRADPSPEEATPPPMQRTESLSSLDLAQPTKS